VLYDRPNSEGNLNFYYCYPLEIPVPYMSNTHDQTKKKIRISTASTALGSDFPKVKNTDLKESDSVACAITTGI